MSLFQRDADLVIANSATKASFRAAFVEILIFSRSKLVAGSSSSIFTWSSPSRANCKTECQSTIRNHGQEQEGSASPVGLSPQRYLPQATATVAIQRADRQDRSRSSLHTLRPPLSSSRTIFTLLTLTSGHFVCSSLQLFLLFLPSALYRGNKNRHHWCRQLILIVLHRYTYLRDHVVLLFHSPPRALDPMRL